MNRNQSKSNIKTPCICGIVLLLLVMDSTARAQIYATQDGHALDANPRLGSMGLNPNARLDALAPRLNNNLYITGNVSGGGNFQGVVPYRSAMEFQGTLGSSTLSNFRRDSVGVNNLSSHIQTRRPFIDTSRTVTGIHQQQVVSSYEFYQSKQMNASLFHSRLNRRANRSLAIRPLEQPNFSLNVSKQRNVNLFTPLTQAGIKQNGLDQPFQPVTDERNLRQAIPSIPPRENRERSNNAPLLENELLNALGTGQPGDRDVQYTPTQDETLQTPTGNQEPQNNVTEYEKRIFKGHHKTAYQPKPFQPKQPSYTQTPATVQTDAQLSDLRKEFEARSRRLFQTNMQKADELLRKGKFYRAADAYELAMVYDVSSGIAHQRKAYALFGAGEYMSSAYFLYQALTLDPTLTTTRTDLRKQFNNEKKFQNRMKELDDWQTKSNAAELKFLQGYILYQVGSLDQAHAMLTDALMTNPTLLVIQPILNAIETNKK